MIKIQFYCKKLSWNPTRLAARADINYRTALSALNGGKVIDRTRIAIAEALSEALHEEIFPGELYDEVSDLEESQSKQKMQTVA